MARPLRVEYPGAYYHVINRGNAGEDIFHSIRDHEKFLEYLEKAVERFSIIVHTYCLMTNHYHLLSYRKIIDIPHRERQGKKTDIGQQKAHAAQ